MNLFKNRPFALITAVFVMTSVLFVNADAKIKLILIAAVVTAAMIYSATCPFIKSAKRYLKPTLSCAVVAALTLLSLFLRVDSKYNDISNMYGEITLEGTVVQTVREGSYSGAYIIDVTDVSGNDAHFTVLCETDFAVDLSVGDVVSVTGILTPSDEAMSADKATYYFSKGVVALIEPDESSKIEVTDSRIGVDTYIAKLRSKLSARLFVSMEGVGGDDGITSALFLGDRDALAGEVYRDFKYIGSAHLLALSGMHLSILIGAVELMLRRMTLHKTPRTLIVIGCTVLYIGLAGCSSSVLRAGIMLIIYYLSYFFRREPDRVTSLFSSVALIVAVFPFAAADTGLLLSFSAMLACIYATELSLPRKLTDKLTEWSAGGSIRKKTVNLIKQIYANTVTSLLALIFTLPVMWMTFGRVSLLSPLSTLILSVPISLILYLCPIVLLAFGIPWLTTAVSVPTALLCRACSKIASALASFDGVQLSLPSNSAFAGVACTVLVVCITATLAADKRTAKRSGGVTLLCVLLLFSGLIIYRGVYDGNTVNYIKIGKNEAIVITDGSSVLICDVSEGRGRITTATVEKAYQQPSTKIDVYMLTHLHYRHARLVALLCRDEYVCSILLPLPETEAEQITFDYICDVADEVGVPVKIYTRGDAVTFGDVIIEADTATISRSEHPVVTVSIESEDERTTYVGSSVHESELFERTRELTARSDSVIFGIHGPVYKSGADYGINTYTSVLYADWSVADYFVRYNNVPEWDVYVEP